jgi:Zn finger protein HypA/HybF involved in hydrogenase expression
MQTVTENLSPDNFTVRHFALCESCFWSATILRMEHDVACPACTDSNVSLIPLAIDDQYRIKLGSTAGLELSFSKRSR